jgi:hypothetical protein
MANKNLYFYFPTMVVLMWHIHAFARYESNYVGESNINETLGPACAIVMREGSHF